MWGKCVIMCAASVQLLGLIRGALSWSIVDFVDYITKVLHGHLHHGQVTRDGACAHRAPWSHAKFGLPEVNW